MFSCVWIRLWRGLPMAFKALVASAGPRCLSCCSAAGAVHFGWAIKPTKASGSIRHLSSCLHGSCRSVMFRATCHLQTANRHSRHSTNTTSTRGRLFGCCVSIPRRRHVPTLLPDISGTVHHTHQPLPSGREPGRVRGCRRFYSRCICRSCYHYYKY
jgi:hypothetical protein